MKKVLAGSSAVIALMAGSGSAIAQATPSGSAASSTTSPATAPATDADAGGQAAAQPQDRLGEIIVTAQRRAENLQRAAVPVDVVSAQAVIQSGATDPTGLSSVVPALSASPNGGGTTSFFIRGVGNFSSNPLFEPAIAFNYDNVYIGRATATAGLFTTSSGSKCSKARKVRSMAAMPPAAP